MSSAKTTYLYRGHIVSPVSKKGAALQSLEYDFIDLSDGILAVEEGKIVAVLEASTLEAQALLDKVGGTAVLVDCSERLIMPGLVDMHLHLPQVTQTAKSGQHLLSWLNQYIFPAEARFAEDEHARKIARWFFKELAVNGTTLAVVFTTIHENACRIAFEEAEAAGARVIMGKVMMDFHSPEALTEKTDKSLEQSLALAKRWHGAADGLLQYAFTPRFGVTSTKELLKGCGELWNSLPGTYLHTHLSEAREEIQTVSSMFPESRSYLDMYSRFGLTGKRSVFAHSIHLDDWDFAHVKESGSALAHCPSSNFFLKSGVFHYKRARECGCLFGLGSDVAAGPHMSLFEVMKDANFIQPDYWIEPRELFYRATLGGARALYMGEQVGSLEVGKEADFIVVDPRAKSGIVDNIMSHPTDEILSCLVFLGDDRLIDQTYVRGRLLFDKSRSCVKSK